MPLQDKQSEQPQPQHQMELLSQLRDRIKEELKREIAEELKQEVRKELIGEWETKKQNKQSPEMEREPPLFGQAKTDQSQIQTQTRDQVGIKTELKKEIAIKQQQLLPNKMDEFMAELVEKLSKPIPPSRLEPMVETNKQPKKGEDSKKAKEEQKRPKKEPIIESGKELKEDMSGKIIKPQEESDSIEKYKNSKGVQVGVKQSKMEEESIPIEKKQIEQNKPLQVEYLKDFPAMSMLDKELKELQLQKKTQMKKLSKEFRAAMALGMQHKKLMKEEQQDEKSIIDRKNLSRKITELNTAMDSLGKSTKKIKEEAKSETQLQAQQQQEPLIEQTRQKHISQEAMNQRKAEIRNGTMVDNIRTMIVKLSENCFRGCVSHYSASLEAPEQACIGDCMNTYIDSYRLVNRVFVNRIHAEHKKRQEQRQEQQMSEQKK